MADTNGFYEEDEPVSVVMAAFLSGFADERDVLRGEGRMSYSSRMGGGLIADPPMRWSKSNPVTFGCLRLALKITYKEVEEGTLVCRDLMGVKACELIHDHGDVDDQLRKIVAFTSPFLKFRGYLDFVGEGGDLWRITVIDHKIKMFLPEIIWPDEVAD